ncbi:Uncharacterised protein [uncultured archaeon]|nr:Uncharacterised protein [uncultured archaeon]
MKKLLAEYQKLFDKVRKSDPEMGMISAIEICTGCGEPGMIRWTRQHGMKWDHECKKDKSE